METNNMSKEMYEKVKGNKRYCDICQAYNSGGNVILTEMPFEYNGMDCFMLLDDYDYLEIYINRLTEYEEEPFYDEYSVIYFNADKRISEEFLHAAKTLMKEKCKYYKKFGFDYKTYCEENYDGKQISYYDLFENFNGGN